MPNHSRSTPNRTSIVIVAWNSGRVLAKCIASIVDHVPASDREIIVVDNDSEDVGYLEPFRTSSEVHVVYSSENLGYARAANLGLSCATGEYFLILNPDIIFTENPFPRLIEELKSRNDLGAVAPLLRDAAGRPQVAGYYRRFPNPLRHLLNDTLLAKWSRVQALSLRISHARLHENGGVQIVDQIPGAFLFFRGDAFDRGTWMNGAYFLWMEDVDFCFRLKASGKHVAVVTDVSVIHIGGTSFVQRAHEWNRRIFTQSQLIYLQSHSSLVARWTTRGIMVADSLARLAWLALRRIRMLDGTNDALVAEFSVLKLLTRGFQRAHEARPARARSAALDASVPPEEQ